VVVFSTRAARGRSSTTDRAVTISGRPPGGLLGRRRWRLALREHAGPAGF
jgi:hypothetical protein